MCNRKRAFSTAPFTHSYNFGVFRRSAWLLSILAAACPLVGQSAVNNCAKLNPKLVFEDTTNGMRLIYHVPTVDGISGAWLEVWDRPKRLFRTAVPVKTDGQIIWEPDEPYPTTPGMLSLAIDDAELPEYCADSIGGPLFWTLFWKQRFFSSGWQHYHRIIRQRRTGRAAGPISGRR